MLELPADSRRNFPVYQFGIFAAFLVLAATVQADESSVVGRWATDDSILEVSPAHGTLSMRVVAMKDPLYLENEDPGPPGAPRRDVNNPEPALREQLILGLELLSGYKYSKGKWQGRIYDPESGNVYKSTMHVEDGELKMRGYIGLPMFGRTQSFLPASGCAPHVVQMARSAELAGINCAD
jgi:uncharacterized protein (DUF2147 family)